jgi:hypothetical protein
LGPCERGYTAVGHAPLNHPKEKVKREMQTNVANIRKLKAGWENDIRFVYIGRQGRGHDGYFGNPYPLQKGEPRGTTIQRFRDYATKRIAEDPEYRRRVKGLYGKTLVCFCHPAPCHGDVLAELAEELATPPPTKGESLL